MKSDTISVENSASQSWLRRAAAWIADHELWFLWLIVPSLIFPDPWVSLGLLLVAVTWLARRITYGRLVPANPLNIPVFAFLLLSIMGFFIGVDPSFGQMVLRQVLMWFVIFTALVSGLRTERSILYASSAILWLGFFLAVFSLLGANWDIVRIVDAPAIYDRMPRLFTNLGQSMVGGSVDSSEIPSGFSLHPRQAGGFLGMLLPLAVAVLFFARGRQLRLPAALFVIIAVPTLILTQALFGIFGLSLGLILIALWWRPRLTIIVMAILTGALAWLVYNNRNTIASPMLDIEHVLGAGLVLRLDMWSRALAMIGDMPFTGTGLFNFPPMISEFYAGYAIGPEIFAHNLALQTALNIGLPGLVFSIWILIAYAAVSIRAYRLTSSRNLRVLLVGLAASILSYVAMGLADPIAIFEWFTGFLFGIGAAIFVFVEDSAGVERESTVWRQAKNWRLVLPVILILALVLVLFPNGRTRNWGLIWAHKALYQAVETGTLRDEYADRALPALSRALVNEPDRAQLYGTRASLYAWQGDQEAALTDLNKRIDLDLLDPLGTYAPFVIWKAKVDGDTVPDNENSLELVYRRWSNRNKKRAEYHVLHAMAMERVDSDAARAISHIEQGLEQGATPRALLEQYLRRLKEKNSDINPVEYE